MKIDCVQCGGEIEVTGTDLFVQCPFCGSSLVADLAGTVQTQIIHPTVDERNARALVVREFDNLEVTGVQVTAATLNYIPFWRIESGGRAHVSLARSVEDTELWRVQSLSGETVALAPETAGELALDPGDIDLETATADLKVHGQLNGEPDRVAMVYAPFFTIEWQYGEQSGRALVDAVGGRVHEDEPPHAAVLTLDRRFGGMMAAALALFFVETILLGPAWGALAVAATGGLLHFLARRRAG